MHQKPHHGLPQRVAILAIVICSLLYPFHETHAEYSSSVHDIPMAYHGENCRIDPDPLMKEAKSWSKPEQWAWTRICEGRDADFNAHLGHFLDPRSPSSDSSVQKSRRVISASFLRTILLHEPFRSAIPHRGVHFLGAYFPDGINLSDAPIERPLTFIGSIFDSKVDLARLKTSSFVGFRRSRLAGPMDMDSSQIGGDLFLRESKFAVVNLQGARIGGQIDMSDSVFIGPLVMNAASVASHLILHDATFGESSSASLLGATIGGTLDVERATLRTDINLDAATIGADLLMKNGNFSLVNLRGVRVSGQIAMVASRFHDLLVMDGAEVGSGLLMRGSEFSEVMMKAAKVNDQLDMVGSKFNGKVNLDATTVITDLFMRKATMAKQAKFIFLRVGSNLDIRGATLGELDLSGAQVKGELRLGALENDNVEWKVHMDDAGECTNPKLLLRNTSVGTLDDDENAWPSKLKRELEGFTYGRLGGFERSEETSPYARRSEWYIEWLARDSSYSPQPYQHLASVMMAAGREGMAHDVLVARHERERSLYGPLELSWWGMSALKIFIGYGYGWRYFLVLPWVIVFVACGTGLLYVTKSNRSERRQWSFLDTVFYSLDMLLPIIRLNEQHYSDVQLQGVTKYYFYGHQIFGYLLVFFLLAGLSGLTK